MNTFFSDKKILWRKMAKIWLKIWLKVKENGTKKNQSGENGGERKKNPGANPADGRCCVYQHHGKCFVNAWVVKRDRFWARSFMVLGDIWHCVKSQLIATAGNLTAVRYRDTGYSPPPHCSPSCSNVDWFYSRIMLSPS